MDPYERLTAINEALNGEEPESTLSFSKAYDDKKKILKAIEKAGNSTENYKKVAARLKAHYDNEDSRGSPFGRSILDSFNPSENPNAKIDQAGARGKRALKNAGIKFKFRGGIGSMNREDNHYIVSSEDVGAAEKALKDIPNAQVKTK